MAEEWPSWNTVLSVAKRFEHRNNLGCGNDYFLKNVMILSLKVKVKIKMINKKYSEKYKKSLACFKNCIKRSISLHLLLFESQLHA